jgi:hypothetical protein
MSDRGDQAVVLHGALQGGSALLMTLAAAAIGTLSIAYSGLSHRLPERTH